MAPSDPMPRYLLYCLPLTKISSPGASAVPANSDPSMVVDAPAASALAISPEYCNPPSPITGTPAGPQTATASRIAVICGAPTPATTRVVQIEPGPTPTLTASAPASSSACEPALVATLPPITSTLVLALICATMSSTGWAWPCEVSTTRKSTPASISACARPLASSPTP